MSHHSHTHTQTYTPLFGDLAVVGWAGFKMFFRDFTTTRQQQHVMSQTSFSFCIDNMYYFTRHNRQLLLVCLSLCESGIPCTFWHDPVERKRKCINILFNLQALFCFSYLYDFLRLGFRSYYFYHLTHSSCFLPTNKPLLIY